MFLEFLFPLFPELRLAPPTRGQLQVSGHRRSAHWRLRARASHCAPRAPRPPAPVYDSAGASSAHWCRSKLNGPMGAEGAERAPRFPGAGSQPADPAGFKLQRRFPARARSLRGVGVLKPYETAQGGGRLDKSFATRRGKTSMVWPRLLQKEQ